MNLKSTKGKVIVGLVAAAVVGSGVYAYMRATADTNPFDTVTVARRDLQEEVDVTGEVQPTEEVQLAFDVSGRIGAVHADVGDVVKRGQVLVELVSSELAAQLQASRAAANAAQSVSREYELALQAEEAKLDELRLGTRPEELFVAETKLVNAKQALQDAQANLSAVKQTGEQELNNLYLAALDVLNEAYVAANDALVKYTDELFTNTYTSKNELVFIVVHQENKALAEDSRGLAYTAVSAFSNKLVAVSTDHQAIDTLLQDALGYLVSVQQFLSNLNIALADSFGVPATTLSSYKANVSTARSGVVAAISSVNKQVQAISAQEAVNAQNTVVAQNQVNDANNTVSLAQSELNLLKSGTLPEQIKAQEARVQQARVTLDSQKARVNQAWAEVEQVGAQLAKYTLRSPLDGVVTKMETHVGEIVGANVHTITVISQAAFEIVANVPEADIAKIQIADPATLTLDAYSDRDVFRASVVKIDPGQIKVEGVTTYKVTLQFTEPDSRVRSGMTANIVLVTDTADDVLVVPQRAVFNRDSHQFVRVPAGVDVEEKVVKTGLSSGDGFVEITSGLAEGDVVIIGIKE